MKSAVILLILLTCFGCRNDGTLFEKTDPTQTGVAFSNQLTETEQENILSFEYFYNGAGVAAGDLNNDGRPDLYFTGNQVGNKLFLNKTEAGQSLKFTDATAQAGVAGRPGGWKTGVTLADVNADGWLDIYVCYSGMRPDSLRRNQLFINNKTTVGGVPTFTERAHEYGIDDSGYSVQANFFDYDCDGDLDCFLINHNLKNYQRKEAAVMRAERDYNAGDKLFRNEGGRFVDVSEAEGIKGNPLGFGLGVSVSDVNNDGWPDVYVTNDFVEDDYLYINHLGNKTQGIRGKKQEEGDEGKSQIKAQVSPPASRLVSSKAFRDELRERINHTSYSAMGVDIADVNNDARPDIFTLDMLPEDNARQKLLIWPDNWQVYQAQLKNGFWHQNMRNMLQINEPGESGHFAEIGQLAGVSATDWSWGALLADFDLDGRKDLFVSNGLGRDLTNADFTKYISYEEEMRTGTSMLEQLKQMPSTPTKNYIFRNTSGADSVTFQNRQKEWGFDENTRSNGCAYADLDGDGDLDLITNNLNEPARVYRNTQREQEQGHYLKIKLKGPAGNPFGIGATVTVSQTGKMQTQEFFPTRGYLSCSHDALLFGLPDGEKPVRLHVRWPDGSIYELSQTQTDQTLTVDYKQAKPGPASLSTVHSSTALSSLPPFLPSSPLSWTHTLTPVNDFERQLMLPMQYSYTGPRMAVGDINGDGVSDAFVCGTPEKPGAVLLGMKPQNGVTTAQETRFTQTTLPDTAHRKNTAAVLADFNGDKQPDLYVVNGAYNLRDFGPLQDQLWLNNNGTLQPAPLPDEKINGSCVVALDVDKDGDMDLFVGGHVRPNRFPLAEESLLLINDGNAPGGVPHFTQKSLGRLGLVTDATTTDLNKDGWPDLIVVGEWMPVTVLKNSKGQLQPNEQTDEQTNNLRGWWNRIEKADLDGDGDEDLIVGNLGKNTQFHATEAEPATMVYDDFDQNGTIDCFMNYFIQGKSYPAYTRDEVGDQVTSLRRTFTTYAAYSTATIDQFFDQSVLQQAHKEIINELRTIVLENANGELLPHVLPQPAQVAPVYSILAEDFDHDGKKDLLLLGNNSYFRLRLGKVDANHGVLLHNNGAFQFQTVPPDKTGLFITGDVRDAKRVGNSLLIGQCNGPLQTFTIR
ncbi:VCBS repeat-containing protein [Fibrella sp. HMF5335]|uniref:VCBS repeat-containing protein n=1 Tax=Fibrella rubiginis TaxID=2817060 RepID=A0A939GKA5_9BACT|nr:VCBS repeat-containing protein [Fibrella rubiginis]MBO0938012.1 VCBS repeat-containing protein [Fibrella rubiginis]